MTVHWIGTSKHCHTVFEAKVVHEFRIIIFGFCLKYFNKFIPCIFICRKFFATYLFHTSQIYLLNAVSRFKIMESAITWINYPSFHKQMERFRCLFTNNGTRERIPIWQLLQKQCKNCIFQLFIFIVSYHFLDELPSWHSKTEQSSELMNYLSLYHKYLMWLHWMFQSTIYQTLICLIVQ